MAAGWSRHESADLTMGFDDDGVIRGVHIDFVSDAGAYPTPWPAMPAMSVGMIFPGPYRVPAAGYRLRSVYTNTAGRSGYRGPWQYETLAREVVLDIAARRMGIDPVELRRRNLLRLDEMPYKNANGMRYDNVSPLETFEQAVEILGYEAFRAEQTRALDAGRFLGVGFSNYVEPTTPVFGIFSTEAATIRIEPTGMVNVYVAGGSSGNSLETAVVQLTADALGVDIEDVNTIQGDTALTGFGGGTGGSRSGAMLAGAIGETAGVLRQRIVAIAAHRFEAAEADIELSQSSAHVRGTPAMTMSLAEIASLAYFSPAALPDGVPPGLEASQPVQPQGPGKLGERHPRLHLRGRRSHRTGEAPAVHRQRGLRPDDQPERGRGPDRRGHGAGDRRGTARGDGLRRGRQPLGDHVRRLPAPDVDRDPRHRVRPPRDAGADARRLQGRRRGRRDRRPARGRRTRSTTRWRRSASP